MISARQVYEAHLVFLATTTKAIHPRWDDLDFWEQDQYQAQADEVNGKDMEEDINA